MRMVKADIKRDYYADLGLDPKAEEDEIRKKYRKLGRLSAPFVYASISNPEMMLI